MATLDTQLRTVTADRQDTPGRSLLVGGLVAGPLYVAVALAQAVSRPGFDLRRHDVSLLANGGLGWIQIGNFLISGLLVIAAAIGLDQMLTAGRGRTWGPRLIGVYGVCIVLAGVFVADPMGGFPPGASDSARFSWHGGVHLLCAAIGFLTLIAACFVFARRFLSEGRRAWGAYSTANGAVFLVTFLGSVVLSGSPSTAGLSVLGLWIAVLVAWSWLAVIASKEMRA